MAKLDRSKQPRRPGARTAVRRVDDEDVRLAEALIVDQDGRPVVRALDAHRRALRRLLR